MNPIVMHDKTCPSIRFKVVAVSDSSHVSVVPVMRYVIISILEQVYLVLSFLVTPSLQKAQNMSSGYLSEHA